MKRKHTNSKNSRKGSSKNSHKNRKMNMPESAMEANVSNIEEEEAISASDIKEETTISVQDTVEAATLDIDLSLEEAESLHNTANVQNLDSDAEEAIEQGQKAKDQKAEDQKAKDQKAKDQKAEGQKSESQAKPRKSSRAKQWIDNANKSMEQNARDFESQDKSNSRKDRKSRKNSMPNHKNSQEVRMNSGENHKEYDKESSYRTYQDVRKEYHEGSFEDLESSDSNSPKNPREQDLTNIHHSEQAIRENIYNFIHDILMKWHLILLCMVAFAVVGDSVLTFMYHPTYTTSASVIIKQDSYNNQEESLDDIAEALSFVISSDVFLEEIKRDMGEEKMDGHYIVRNMEGTSILKITAQADSPKVSYRMMYYMMRRYKDIMRYVVGDTSLRVIDNIQVPTIADNFVAHKRNLLIFGLIGAAFMTLILGMQSAMRDTIKCQEDVHDKMQIRMLADIATESKWYLDGRKLAKKRGLLLTQLSTSFTFVETFKRLGNRFEMEARKNHWKTVLINSTWEDEGKTSVITNLAIQLAKMNRRILLVDTDFGKPALEKILEVEPEHGLEEALRGEMAFEDIIYHDKKRKFDCVFVKKVISDATTLLEGEELTQCLNSVKDNYDYILLDTPPTSYLGMSMIVAQHADAVLLVTRQNFAPTVMINRTVERYLRQDTPVMGCVLNRSMPRIGLRGQTYR